MLPEIRKQNLLAYLQIRSRLQGETPIQGHNHRSLFVFLKCFPVVHKRQQRVFDLNDEASLLKEGDNWKRILCAYLYWMNSEHQ